MEKKDIIKQYVDELWIDHFIEISNKEIKSIKDYLQNTNFDKTLIGFRFFTKKFINIDGEIYEGKPKNYSEWISNDCNDQIYINDEHINLEKCIKLQEFIDSTMYKRILSNDELLDENLNYQNEFLNYSYQPNSIGIVDRMIDGKRKYFVYKIGERNIDWEIETDSFNQALSIAKEKYSHLKAYLDEIDKPKTLSL